VGYLFVTVTLLLTVIGQVVFKWRVDAAGDIPDGTRERIEYLLGFLVDPWVVAVAFATLLAALAWMLALTRLDLSDAYPFMSLSFVFVLLLSGVFFGEAITTSKLLGLLLIVGGLVVGSRL
jgi:drug/metabolite transporter (DMT)-like permease